MLAGQNVSNLSIDAGKDSVWSNLLIDVIDHALGLERECAMDPQQFGADDVEVIDRQSARFDEECISRLNRSKART